MENLLLIAECSLPGEWEGQVIYLPLRQPALASPWKALVEPPGTCKPTPDTEGIKLPADAGRHCLKSCHFVSLLAGQERTG